MATSSRSIPQKGSRSPRLKTGSIAFTRATNASRTSSLTRRPSRPPDFPVWSEAARLMKRDGLPDRKSTRLNSSHSQISYAVLCLKKNTINPDTNKIPKHLFQSYLNIYNIYFKAPWMPDRAETNPHERNRDDARYGCRYSHLRNIWTAPLPPETELSRQMTTSTTSIDIMGLQAAYANLHTDQERDSFMQRYHDVISSFGGKASYDADTRPLLVMRSNFWASGYDVDGTDQTS